jgi:hypothetical protein
VQRYKYINNLYNSLLGGFCPRGVFVQGAFVHNIGSENGVVMNEPLKKVLIFNLSMYHLVINF